MTFYNSDQLQLPSPPRSVIASKPATQVRRLLWGASILLVVMLAFLVSLPVQRDLKLLHGAQTTGTIVDKSVRLGKSASYRTQVQFVAGGRTVVENVRVERDEYEGLAIGDHTLLTYLPGDPSVAKLGAVTSATASSDLQRSLPLVLPNLLLALCGPLLIEFVIRGQMRLLRMGREAMATVERVEKGEKQSVRVFYWFEAEGSRWKGSSLASSRSQVAPGQIPVLYLTGQPQKSKAASSLSLVTLRNGTMPT